MYNYNTFVEDLFLTSYPLITNLETSKISNLISYMNLSPLDKEGKPPLLFLTVLIQTRLYHIFIQAMQKKKKKKQRKILI